MNMKRHAAAMIAIVFLAPISCNWFSSAPEIPDGDADGEEGDPGEADLSPDQPDALDLLDIPDQTEPVSEPECTGSGDCDDGEPCNGQETCDGMRCMDGTPLPDGSTCTSTLGLSGVCTGNVCIPLSCGNGTIDPGEECDDGNSVNGDGCDNDCTFSCVQNSDCDDGMECTQDSCELTSHICRHILLGADEVCRPSAGDCDLDDYCDGMNLACQPDIFRTPGTLCRPSIGPCDLEELCTGMTPACPADVFLLAGEPCDDGDVCTFPDTCDGAGSCIPGPAGLHQVAAVEVGNYHSCTLLESGGMKCWGRNYNGQVGDGTTTTFRYWPVDVVGLPGTVASITAGRNFSCARTASGAALCWGHNFYGQVGDGTTSNRYSPVHVSGLASGVSAMTGNCLHACALMASGTLMCWGSNGYGQLGDGTLTQRNSPVTVAGFPAGYLPVAVSNGDGHTCALMNTGSVTCWGDNRFGQLGDNPVTQSSTPLTVPGTPSGIAMLSCGGYHTCVLTTGGGLKCWGQNSYGQLGDGTTTNRPTPVDVAGLTAGVTWVSAGMTYTCAVLNLGEVRCWGNNSAGQIGDGTTTSRPLPVTASGLLTGVAAVAAEGDFSEGHACALLDDGGVRCWGYGIHGQLGDGRAVSSLVPVDVSCPP